MIPSINTQLLINSRFQTARQSTGNRSETTGIEASESVQTDNETSGSNFEQVLRNLDDIFSITQLSDGLVQTVSDLFQNIRITARQAAIPGEFFEKRQELQENIAASIAQLKELAEDMSVDEVRLFSELLSNNPFPVGPDSSPLNMTFGSLEPDLRVNETFNNILGIDVTTGPGAREAVRLANLALDFLSGSLIGHTSGSTSLESTFNNLSGNNINLLLLEDQLRSQSFSQEEANIFKARLLLEYQSSAALLLDTGGQNLIDLFE